MAVYKPSRPDQLDANLTMREILIRNEMGGKYGDKAKIIQVQHNFKDSEVHYAMSRIQHDYKVFFLLNKRLHS